MNVRIPQDGPGTVHLIASDPAREGVALIQGGESVQLTPAGALGLFMSLGEAVGFDGFPDEACDEIRLIRKVVEFARDRWDDPKAQRVLQLIEDVCVEAMMSFEIDG